MNILYIIQNPFQSALHNNSAFKILDSLSQNIVILLGKSFLYFIQVTYICYDDGCHLRKFARNPIRKDLTPTSKKIASLEIVVNKMHMAGHVDKLCMANCDPRNIAELNNVSTQTCAASIFHSCYYSLAYKLLFEFIRLIRKSVNKSFHGYQSTQKITRKMKKAHFMFYLLYICDYHNQREELKRTQVLNDYGIC